MKSRTKARSLALQALYEVDITGHPAPAAIEERLADEPLDDNLADFARQIVFGVLPLVGKLDNFISQHAPEWPLDQVAVVDRNILRIALWEFAVARVTPIKVAINEAIEMAKEAIQLYIESLQAHGEQVPTEAETLEYTLMVGAYA